MPTEDFTWENGRGDKLHAVAHKPAGPTRAVVVMHHGYGEHSGRYREEFDRLATKDIAVYAYDAAPFGRSQPDNRKRGDIQVFDHFVDDLESFAAYVREQPVCVGKPLFLAGQSLGGLIATRTVVRDQSKYSGLALFSAALDCKRNLILMLLDPLSGIAAGLIPMARIAPAVDPKDLSVDKKVIDDFLADPNVFSGPVRARFAHLAKNAFADTVREYDKVTLPIVMFHGDKDNIAPISQVELLMSKAPSTDKTSKVFPGAFHELVHGPEKTELFDTLSEWILQRK